MSDINEKTRVPLFALIPAVGALLGGMAWLTAMYEKVTEAAVVNERQDAELKELSRLTIETHDAVLEIRDRIKSPRCR